MSREIWPDDERGPNRDYRMRDGVDLPEEVDGFPRTDGQARPDRPPVKAPQRIAAGPPPATRRPYNPREELSEHGSFDPLDAADCQL